MEATLILFGPAATPSDPAELAEACGTFRKKVERLLGGAKYKPVDAEQRGSLSNRPGRYKFGWQRPTTASKATDLLLVSLGSQ